MAAILNAHKTLDTLPIGCYARVHNSIVKGKPEYKWLLKFDYETEDFEGDLPDGLPDLYEILNLQLPESFFDISKIQMENKYLRLVADFNYKKIVEKTDERTLALLENDIEILEFEIKAESTANKAKEIDIIDITTSIEMQLHTNIDIFKYSTSKFFNLYNKLSKYGN